MTSITSISQADGITGGMSKPSKMPGYAYSLPAVRCKVGGQLVKIPNSVCSDCYAMKGRYRFKNVQEAQERRYRSLDHPQWVEAMVFTIKRRKINYFRWHDSGDVQSYNHLCKIVEIAVACPDTKFWMPTRENALVAEYMRRNGDFPSNLVVRVSGAMIDGPQPIRFVNTSTVTTSKEQVTCPAYKQGGVCGDCRKCWDRSVHNIAYPRH